MNRTHSVYGIIVDGTVRYVGRSVTNDRVEQHLRAARRWLKKRSAGLKATRHEQLVHRKLAAAIERELPIEATEFVAGLSFEEACSKEIEVIASFPKDQLWNLHPGGRGGNTEAASAALRKKWAEDTEFRRRQSEKARSTLLATLANEETAQKRLNSVKQQWTEERLVARSEASKRMAADSEFQARRLAAASRVMKAKWEDPQFREKEIASEL